MSKKISKITFHKIINKLEEVNPRAVKTDVWAFKYKKPDNILGFIAQSLGYIERQGHSVYWFVQEKTGWSLKDISTIISLRRPESVIRYINWNHLSD